MNIAMLHFHLRRRGVSSVVRRQLECLSARAGSPGLALLVGSEPETASPVPWFVVPGLEYDSVAGRGGPATPADAAKLAGAIEAGLAAAFPGGCDLLHVHNPLLRKNRNLVGALNLLRERGLALLLEIHDLAEDFRPEVYEAFWPYPEGCDYATINSRDRDNLVASGLEPAHVHLLPNPVSDDEPFEPREGYEAEALKGRRTALYPVRAIGRKNIGEALFLSAFLPDGAEMALTLPPANPRDLEAYARWKALAARTGWRVRYEAGLATPLHELYDASFCALTTSVQEGFGYSYIDPLLRGLPVFGRRIPHLLRDFARAGIGFDMLYDGIVLPREEVDGKALRAALSVRIERLRAAYGPVFEATPDGEAKDRFEALLERLTLPFEGETLDFGVLDGNTQASLLKRLAGDPGFLRALKGANPFLEAVFHGAPSEEEAVLRRAAALREFSQERLGATLLSVYETAAARNATGRIDKQGLLARYLEPDNFFLSAP